MWVILPVKSFADSKQRLGAVLSEGRRKQLAEAMFRDVLTAISHTPAIKHLLVVTGDETIAAVARDFHAEILMEPEHCSGLNEAVDLAVHHVQMQGGKKALVLHSDIPLANKHDLEYLLSGQFEGSVSLIPDKHGTGTNGMLFDLPCEIAFSFGEGSYQKHQQAIANSNLMCAMAELPDLTLDIDEPEDLLALSLRCVKQPQLATSQLLLRPDMQQIIHGIGVKLTQKKA